MSFVQLRVDPGKPATQVPSVPAELVGRDDWSLTVTSTVVRLHGDIPNVDPWDQCNMARQLTGNPNLVDVSYYDGVQFNYFQPDGSLENFDDGQAIHRIEADSEEEARAQFAALAVADAEEETRATIESALRGEIREAIYATPIEDNPDTADVSHVYSAMNNYFRFKGRDPIPLVSMNHVRRFALDFKRGNTHAFLERIQEAIANTHMVVDEDHPNSEEQALTKFDAMTVTTADGARLMERIQEAIADTPMGGDHFHGVGLNPSP